MLGGVGQGLELTKDWFVEARLQIAANCLGAAIRAFELANEWATAARAVRQRRSAAIQAIEFMLADMAVEIMAAKSMIYRVAWEIDRASIARSLHAPRRRDQAPLLRDGRPRARQGGADLRRRGYMRENPVERLSRDVRVDRIWEGTSEIQRTIIGGQLGKRGHGVYTGWPTY